MKHKLVCFLFTIALLSLCSLSRSYATTGSSFTLDSEEECTSTAPSRNTATRLQQLLHAHDEHLQEQARILQEQQRIMEEQRQEQQRIMEEQRQEQQRIMEEQRQEQQRIREEQRQEQQRIREERRQERLQQKKNQLKVQLAPLLLKQDKKSYNSILAVVTRILDPINQGKHTVRGGIARIDAAMEILNDLLAIHKGVECGSKAKHQRLDALLVKANEDLILLDSTDYLSLDFQAPGLEQPLSEEIQKYKTRVLEHRRWISSIGGNLSIGIHFQGGPGTALGTSTDVCGKRKATIGVLGQFGFGIGVNGSVGYYGYDTTGTRGYVKQFSDENILVSVGCILSGGSTKINPHPTVDIHEIGICAGVHLIKLFSFTGVTLFPLPGQDMKFFRKHVGLVPATAKLSSAFEAEIEQCTSTRALRRIDLSPYLTPSTV